MRHRRVRTLVILSALAMVMTLAVPAAGWDNTYGEPTDDNSFSAVQAVTEAPNGGLYVLGWYYGEFEGLSRPSSYGVFLMQVDAEGVVTDVWDLFETGGVPSGFELARGPKDELWMSPGPNGGVARIEDGSVTTELSHGAIIGASTDLLLVTGGSETFHALDFAGNHKWSWSMYEALEAEGISGAGVHRFEAVADANGIFVTGAWVANYPYANEDGGAWRVGSDGTTMWSTAIVGESTAIPAEESKLTPSRFVVMARMGDIWEFDRESGELTLLHDERFARLCGQDGDTTWHAVNYSRSQSPTPPCPPGTVELGMCSFGDGGPLPGIGSLVQERVYRICGTYVVRWERGSQHWRADVASAPFGTEKGDDSRLWGGLVTSDGSLVLYGQVDRTATFRTSSDRTQSSSHQYSAAVTHGALAVVPEAAGVHRLASDDRFSTAEVIANDRFEPADVSKVYLATGLNFPDALAGGPLAIQDDAPVLLVTQDTLPQPTADALAELAPDAVIALGGTNAINDNVLAAAKFSAGASSASRIFGNDRWETAVAIASRVAPTGTVYLATGTNYPDALAGGPATQGSPILLTAPTELPQSTRDALAKMNPTNIIALGGTSAISDDVLAEAAQAAGGAGTDRLSGGDRYATALDIASTMPSPQTVYITTGLNFPDALAGASAAVTENAPIVLTDPNGLPAAVDQWLRSLPDLRRVVVLGGANAVSDAVVQQLGDVLSS